MSVVTIYLVFSMLAVLYYDVSRYIIPNWLVGLMLAAYPLAVVMARAHHAHVDWQHALLGMGLVLAVGYVIFALKWMGGGDIKLLTACALWTGLDNLLEFIFLVAVIGGVFSLLLWGIRKALPFLPRRPDAPPLPRILREGEPVPYGVAISFGFLLMLYNGKIAAI